MLGKGRGLLDGRLSEAGPEKDLGGCWGETISADSWSIGAQILPVTVLVTGDYRV